MAGAGAAAGAEGSAAAASAGEEEEEEEERVADATDEGTPEEMDVDAELAPAPGLGKAAKELHVGRVAQNRRLMEQLKRRQALREMAQQQASQVEEGLLELPQELQQDEGAMRLFDERAEPLVRGPALAAAAVLLAAALSAAALRCCCCTRPAGVPPKELAAPLPAALLSCCALR
jgi:hypothetical protein